MEVSLLSDARAVLFEPIPDLIQGQLRLSAGQGKPHKN